MALTQVVAARNAISDAVLAEIGNNGKLVLYTSGDAEIATLDLPSPSGTVGATDLTFGTFTDDTNATGGTCTYMAIETTGDVEVFQFPEGDVTLSSTVIGAGDTVQCSSLVYTPPA